MNTSETSEIHFETLETSQIACGTEGRADKSILEVKFDLKTLSLSWVWYWLRSDFRISEHVGHASGLPATSYGLAGHFNR